MKKSLSKQFIALLLIPVCIILTINFIIILQLHKKQDDELKNYCLSTLENINVNISSMTRSMKKTATIFSSQAETQAYLASSSTNSHELQRQSYSELIGMAQSYTPGLVDILVWDHTSPTSLISYIPADMEDFAVNHFQNSRYDRQSYFQFYIQPTTNTPYMIYFSPIYLTSYSENFGKHIGNIAIICKTDTLYQLVNATTDISLTISDRSTNQILYSNAVARKHISARESWELFKKTEELTNTNLNINAIAYTGQVQFSDNPNSNLLLTLAILLLVYILLITLAVQRLIIHPIHQLNAEIENLNYTSNDLHLPITQKNEIGSIASHVNNMLDKITVLNQRDINSQARIYEMELNKKQTQIYAYQSQINPHFLYNMLQCMRGICLMHDVPEAAQICTNMADLFRYSIKGAFLTSLENEISIIDKYLYMIEIRFQGRISYKLEVADNTKECLIPKMILQPIVENAIFHGLDEIEEGGIITIKTTRTENDLFITVTDNGIGFSKEALQNLNQRLKEEITFITNSPSGTSDSIGVINIHNKIRLYEGNDYGIAIYSVPNHTDVTLHLNAKQKITTQ
nr:histidine kinase [uncultured Dorea sp.]